ncbi:MAG: succinylglutamate desuccinylase/aspartoacylase family protein [Planctomycetes bacterium]|nr:succinylglutamate desuccinylase/aspartoacylase family protein [Planctomycetota bacterium]
MRLQPLPIAGVAVRPGTRREVFVKISETFTADPVRVSAIVIRGREPGPVLAVTAAVHGDELNGVEIVRRLAYASDLSHLRGTLILVPVLNPFAFNALSRYLPDGKDLNRYFPGIAGGSMAARIARAVFEGLIRPCRYLIDLHTAGAGRTNLPHVRVDRTNAEARRIARAFGSEIIYDFAGDPQSLRAAAGKAGIAAILFEAGETMKFQPRPVRRGVRGIENVLRRLRMLPGRVRRPRYQIVVKDAGWVRAERGGILHVMVRPGDLVRRGDPLSSDSRPYDRVVSLIRAPYDGLVVSTTTLPVVTPGAPIAHVIRLTKTFDTVARAKAEREERRRR